MTWKEFVREGARKGVDGGRGGKEKDGKEGKFYLQWGKQSPNTRKFPKYKNLSPDFRIPNQCLIFVAHKSAPDGKRRKGREFSRLACTVLKSIRF